MDSPEKDYTHRTWLAAAALIAVLVAVSFIPPQSIGGISLRRANILSDLVTFDDSAPAEQEAATGLYDEEEFRVDLAEVASRAQERALAACERLVGVPVAEVRVKLLPHRTTAPSR